MGSDAAFVFREWKEATLVAATMEGMPPDADRDAFPHNRHRTGNNRFLTETRPLVYGPITVLEKSKNLTEIRILNFSTFSSENISLTVSKAFSLT